MAVEVQQTALLRLRVVVAEGRQGSQERNLGVAVHGVEQPECPNADHVARRQAGGNALAIRRVQSAAEERGAAGHARERTPHAVHEAGRHGIRIIADAPLSQSRAEPGAREEDAPLVHRVPAVGRGRDIRLREVVGDVHALVEVEGPLHALSVRADDAVAAANTNVRHAGCLRRDLSVSAQTPPAVGIPSKEEINVRGVVVEVHRAAAESQETITAVVRRATLGQGHRVAANVHGASHPVCRPIQDRHLAHMVRIAADLEVNLLHAAVERRHAASVIPAEKRTGDVKARGRVHVQHTIPVSHITQLQVDDVRRTAPKSEFT